MKLVSLDEARIEACVKDAQRERVVLTRNNKPVALMVGVEGMDEEQLELGASNKFWKLIIERRAQKTISRADLERKIKIQNRSASRRTKRAKPSGL
ncbi:MAG: hypothetical protein DMF76_25330 [Acidobacteria bacterium]|nr:MAG: hypothetical protein DMF76_25330 [Acidobacteriota bacterium]